MSCEEARSWIFRFLDGELTSRENLQLDTHLAGCAHCTREMRLLSLPRRLGRAIPMLEPSPFFYKRLRARLERESQSTTVWQIVLGLSRQVVPAMAAITLTLVSIFAYIQLRTPAVDIYQAYDRIFMSPDRTNRMVIAEQGEITDESILTALAEEEPARGTAEDPNTPK